MHSNIRRIIRVSSLVFSSFVLLTLLAACDLFGGSGNSSATPTSAPNPTPTQASAALKLYTGDGFTIQYPQDWTVKVDSGHSLVSFTDPITQSTFAIQTTPNPQAAIGSDQIIANAGTALEAVGLTQVKASGSASDTTLAGETWKQQAYTANVKYNGSSVPAKTVVLTNNYPAQSLDTKAYTLLYGAAQIVFDQVNQLDFQPTLQSFKYTS